MPANRKMKDVVGISQHLRVICTPEGGILGRAGALSEARL